MGSDMVVALREASANGTTLFGLNLHALVDRRHSLQVGPGQLHELGENVPLNHLKLPQVRQTIGVLGLQPHGQWGFTHGVNECRVAAGVTEWQSRLPAEVRGLAGVDLLRLCLERGRTALLAVEVLTDLLERHGQASDNIYLIADANEAFVVETCGRYWALLECGHTRAVTDAAMIRQDWRKLSPGLADCVIEKGWWRDDGSKIDFVRCLGESTMSARNAQKRWGRASLALSQQQGAIDAHYLRRMLADHHTSSRELVPDGTALTGSFLANLAKTEGPSLAWCAFGPPRAAVYFPICMAGELPAAFGAGMPMSTTIEERTRELAELTRQKERERDRLTAALERLQAKFDQDADEFEQKAHDYLQHGKPHLVGPIATEMMHQHVELFEKEYRRLFGVEDKTPSTSAVAEEVLFFA